MPMTSASRRRRVEFDDLLDIPPANDVSRRGPVLVADEGPMLSAALTRDGEDSLYAGLTYDIAVGGVFVATFDVPPVGARVGVTLTLENSAFVVSGVVRWVRDVALASEGLPAGCGVEWTGLPQPALAKLRKFAEVREPLLWLAEGE